MADQSSQMLTRLQKICREVSLATGVAEEDVRKVLTVLGLAVTPAEVHAHQPNPSPAPDNLTLDGIRTAMRGVMAGR
jgi:hypothetical protein